MEDHNEKIAMNFWGRVEIVQAQKKVQLKDICRKHGLNYQTMLNQKSTAHLPSLGSACVLAKELGCSVEWLVDGNDEDISLNTCEQLARVLFHNKKLLAITQNLQSMSQEELHSLEILLKIGK